jgi:hypothetical protein
MLTNYTPDAISELQTKPTQTSSTYRMFNSFRSTMRSHGFVIFNCAWDAVSKLVTNAYWISQAVDLINGEDGQGNDAYFANMSFAGFYIGGSLSLVFSIGSIYSHYVLNTNATHANAHRKYVVQEEEIDSEIDNRAEISCLQTMLLCLDAISHTGDGAGTGLALYNLGQPDPEHLEKLFILIGATIGGMLSAQANATTCWHNMRLHNKNVILDSRHQGETLDLELIFIAHELDVLANKYRNHTSTFVLTKLQRLSESVSNASTDHVQYVETQTRRDAMTIEIVQDIVKLPKNTAGNSEKIPLHNGLSHSPYSKS